MLEGTLFEFASVEELLAAIDALRALRTGPLETFTPFAVPEVESKIGVRRTRIPGAVLAAAALGCIVAFVIIWATNAYDYPLDVGGRPLDSIPTDVPILFETTVLFGSLTAFFSVLFRSGMPRLHRPVFEVAGIETASIDRFWVGVSHAGPLDPSVSSRMRELGALSVREMGGAS